MARRLRWLTLVPLALWAVGCSGQTPSENGSAKPADKGGGIAWSHYYEAALAQAKAEGKPLMVDVFATWCKPCQMLDEDVFSKPEVVEASRDFVCAKVDGDQKPHVRDDLGVTGYPTVLFLDSNGSVVRRSRGLVSHEVMLREMAAAVEETSGRTQESD
jgi:thioredoxin 1